MITGLSVTNLAVVESLELSFQPGMSAITGETGAGKSIVLQALNLALGNRGSTDLVRHGKDKASITAVFAVENNQAVQAFLQSQALDDNGECVLRRVIGADGKSKAFVNSVGVGLAVIRSLGELIIDMHGQNEHQLLLRPDQQLLVLDDYAGLGEQKSALNLLVGEHKNLKTKIDNIRQNQATALQQQELFAHQLEELKQAQLSQNELNNIEADFKISANSQALTAEISEILEQLESETGANIQLPNLSHKLSAALAMDKKLAPAAALLSSAQLQTQEAVYELENYLNALTIDEEASSNMESRISEFHELGRKHNCKIQDLLIVQADLKKQLDEIALGADSLDELCAQLDALEGNYKTQAAALSNARTSSAAQLSVQVSQTMRLLGMPASEFKIDLVSKPDGVHLNGAEAAQFLVKTNLGQDFKLLNKIVSGGELSRISLAIAVVGSNSQLAPTLIFDEVDVGISGAVAEVVGRRLQELSATYQVICITHLAQVAAFARQHLRVSKTQNETGAQTAVEQLSEAEKVDEIARILGGSVITEKTRHAAAEMLELSH